MLAYESIGRKPTDNVSAAKSGITGNAVGKFLNSGNQDEATRGALFFSQEVSKNKKTRSLKQTLETETR